MALPTDTIYTVYKNGEFTTYCQQRVKANNQVVSDVSDYLVNDFQTTPGHLFTWALKDLGLQSKGNELIIILKSSKFDENTGITRGTFDIEIPNVTRFNNVKVDVKVAKTKYNNGVTKVNADIKYSTLLLDKAVATFTTIPLRKNEQIFTTLVKIKFGWFFNLFITQNRYKSIVEWRIKKFTDNMHYENEIRQKSLE